MNTAPPDEAGATPPVAAATVPGDGMNRLRAIVTIGLLVTFVGFIVLLVTRADREGQEWERLIYVFSGVEAIVFTAVGWLFGREVNRARAETAETVAHQAQVDAASARADVATARVAAAEANERVNTEAEKGLSLAEAVATHAEAVAGEAAALEPMGPDGRPAPQLAALVAFAKRRYPEIDD